MELLTRPEYHERLLLRVSYWVDLRVVDGRLGATLRVAGDVPLGWFQQLVLRVQGAGPVLLARVSSAQREAAGRVAVLTERVACFGVPNRAFPSSARLHLRPSFMPDPAPEQDRGVGSQQTYDQLEKRVAATARVQSYFAHPAVRRMNRNRIAQIRKIYDAPYFSRQTSRLCFAFWAPGEVLQESWLRTLAVRVRVNETGETHETRISELVEHKHEKDVYYALTNTMPPLWSATDPAPAIEIVVTSACGKFSVRGLSRAK